MYSHRRWKRTLCFPKYCDRTDEISSAYGGATNFETNTLSFTLQDLPAAFQSSNMTYATSGLTIQVAGDYLITLAATTEPSNQFIIVKNNSQILLTKISTFSGIEATQGIFSCVVGDVIQAGYVSSPIPNLFLTVVQVDVIAGAYGGAGNLNGVGGNATVDPGITAPSENVTYVSGKIKVTNAGDHLINASMYVQTQRLSHPVH